MLASHGSVGLRWLTEPARGLCSRLSAGFRPVEWNGMWFGIGFWGVEEEWMVEVDVASDVGDVLSVATPVKGKEYTYV